MVIENIELLDVFYNIIIEMCDANKCNPRESNNWVSMFILLFNFLSKKDYMISI